MPPAQTATNDIARKFVPLRSILSLNLHDLGLMEYKWDLVQNTVLNSSSESH